jgi:GT2 family glycosyltransferase
LCNTYANFEVIFVDNASTDGSLEFVKRKFGSEPKLKLIQNPGSLGPAVGRNRGIAKAEGEYIAFLDNDTEVDSHWISELIKVLESDPTIGLAQSKLLRTEPKDTFDCAGDYLTFLGFLTERARGAKDVGQFDYIADIFSAKSAASIIRKNVLDKIGGFDEDFYMYLEETDLSWRVWLAGLRVAFIPASIVYHAFNTPKKDFKRYYTKHIVRYYGCRNYISTLIKNLEFSNTIKILPLHLGCWVLLVVFFALKTKLMDSLYILKGIGWNLLNLGLLIKKHNYIRGHVRKVRDSEIFKKIMDHKRGGYYFGKAMAYVTGQPF